MMNLFVDLMFHSLILKNQLLTVLVLTAKGTLLIHKIKERMSSLHQLKYNGIGQVLSNLMFSVNRVEQVWIQPSKLVAS